MWHVFAVFLQLAPTLGGVWIIENGVDHVGQNTKCDLLRLGPMTAFGIWIAEDLERQCQLSLRSESCEPPSRSIVRDKKEERCQMHLGKREGATIVDVGMTDEVDRH